MKRFRKFIIFKFSISLFVLLIFISSFIYQMYYYTHNRVGVIVDLKPPDSYIFYFLHIFVWTMLLLTSVILWTLEKKKKQSIEIEKNIYLKYTGSPDIEDYQNLRKITGLSEKSERGAKLGLKNTTHAISFYYDNDLIGMGRIIGDKGCFYQIVDIAVDPNYQGQGFGKLIMNELTTYLDEHAPDGAYVSLIADEPADKLYEKYGFKYTYPASHGMYKFTQRSEEV
ncbi:GNAT family N-acetyltransferase [Chengkuizengella sediminis]|uniref:GNAT family N-acetyltransferase n=1 Tax=Chengkuizengella sediminis TaxID=1885917 RepID=UPI0030B82814